MLSLSWNKILATSLPLDTLWNTSFVLLQPWIYKIYFRSRCKSFPTYIILVIESYVCKIRNCFRSLCKHHGKLKRSDAVNQLHDFSKSQPLYREVQAHVQACERNSGWLCGKRWSWVHSLLLRYFYRFDKL